MRLIRLLAWSVILSLSCGGPMGSSPISPTIPEVPIQIETAPSTIPSPIMPPAILVGAGDIGEPNIAKSKASETGNLLRQFACHGVRVITLGDNTQGEGTSQEFSEKYAPFWGFAEPCTYPVPGNHDYITANGAAYYKYFSNSGPTGKGYYKYDHGAWKVYALNSELIFQSNSLWREQINWFRSELANDPAECTLAYFHRPRFASGTESARQMHDIWTESRKAGLDLILNGHAHYYEEFEPQNELGQFDPEGIRQIIAGTGGTPLRFPEGRAVNSKGSISIQGLIKLTLKNDSYDWEFISIDPGAIGQPVQNSKCQGKPRP